MDTLPAESFADSLLRAAKSREMINDYVQHSIAQKHSSMKLCREIKEETDGKKALQLRCHENNLKVVSVALCHCVVHVLYTRDRSWIRGVRV